MVVNRKHVAPGTLLVEKMQWSHQQSDFLFDVNDNVVSERQWWSLLYCHLVSLSPDSPKHLLHKK